MEKAIKNGRVKCLYAKNCCGTYGWCLWSLPAVLISYQEEYNLSDDEMVKAMYVVPELAKLLAENAFIAGAAGGCQAE